MSKETGEHNRLRKECQEGGTHKTEPLRSHRAGQPMLHALNIGECYFAIQPRKCSSGNLGDRFELRSTSQNKPRRAERVTLLIRSKDRWRNIFVQTGAS